MFVNAQTFPYLTCLYIISEKGWEVTDKDQSHQMAQSEYPHGEGGRTRQTAVEAVKQQEEVYQARPKTPDNRELFIFRLFCIRHYKHSSLRVSN